MRGCRAVAAKSSITRLRYLTSDAGRFTAQFGEASYWDQIYTTELEGGLRSVNEWFMPPKVQPADAAIAAATAACMYVAFICNTRLSH